LPLAGVFIVFGLLKFPAFNELPKSLYLRNKMIQKSLFLTAFFSLVLFVTAVKATVYEVKPNTPLDTIAEVPWATLAAGDTVLIYWRATPYKEKWVICRQGTAAAPITVRGVPNPTTGELPIIDGSGAVTPAGLNFWNDERGVIKIGGANVPADTMPKYITIENLDIRSAHPDYQFTPDTGGTMSYSSSASSIYVEKGENIVIRNNIIHDSANGFFVASSDDTVSRDILVEGNYIYGNGIAGSAFQHNNYTAAIGITFQYNRFGPLRAGSNGNALKDRSAGTVIRYNWIESGNRQLDLVDAEDSVQIRKDAAYHETFVYGNILIEPDVREIRRSLTTAATAARKILTAKANFIFTTTRSFPPAREIPLSFAFQPTTKPAMRATIFFTTRPPERTWRCWQKKVRSQSATTG
jgi:hypothetical protein